MPETQEKIPGAGGRVVIALGGNRYVVDIKTTKLGGQLLESIPGLDSMGHPRDLRDLVQEFIQVATVPRADERSLSSFLLEILRNRIAARKHMETKLAQVSTRVLAHQPPEVIERINQYAK